MSRPNVAPTEDCVPEIRRSLVIPDPCLVVIVGSAGAGKSTFCSNHFEPSEIISSDRCRAILTSSEHFDPTRNGEVFEMFHRMIEERLSRGLLAVADSTALLRMARGQLLALAQRFDVPAVAVVLDVPPSTCVRQDAQRPRRVGGTVIESHARDLANAHIVIPYEPFARVHVVGEHERDNVLIERQVGRRRCLATPLPLPRRRRDPEDVLDARTMAAAMEHDPMALATTDAADFSPQSLTLLRAVPEGRDFTAWMWRDEAARTEAGRGHDLPANQLAGQQGLDSEGPALEVFAENMREAMSDSSFWRRKRTGFAAFRMRLAPDGGVYALAPMVPPPRRTPAYHDYFWEYLEMSALCLRISLPESLLICPDRVGDVERGRDWISGQIARGRQVLAASWCTAAAPAVAVYGPNGPAVAPAPPSRSTAWNNAR